MHDAVEGGAVTQDLDVLKKAPMQQQQQQEAERVTKYVRLTDEKDNFYPSAASNASGLYLVHIQKTSGV